MRGERRGLVSMIHDLRVFYPRRKGLERSLNLAAGLEGRISIVTDKDVEFREDVGRRVYVTEVIDLHGLDWPQHFEDLKPRLLIVDLNRCYDASLLSGDVLLQRKIHLSFFRIHALSKAYRCDVFIIFEEKSPGKTRFGFTLEKLGFQIHCVERKEEKPR